MSIDLAARLSLLFTGRYIDTGDMGDTIHHMAFHMPDRGQKYTVGTGTNKINRLWDDERTISAPESLDLFGGLTDRFGNVLNLTKIKLLLIENTTRTTGSWVKLSGNLATSLGYASHPVDPGGFIAWHSPVDGIAVTNGSADTLTFTPTGSVTYRIVIGGEQ